MSNRTGVYFHRVVLVGVWLIAWPAYAVGQENLTPKLACTGSSATSTDRSDAPPIPISEEAPPIGRKRPRPGTYRLTLTVTVEGIVDTSAVTIDPALPPEYLPELKRALGKYRFRPAQKAGCPVVGTYTYTMTFA